MSALSDAASVANDPAFRTILTAGLMKAALDVYSEDAATAGHTQRIALARKIIASPGSPQLLDTVAWAVSTNPTVVGEWTSGNQDGAAGDLAFVLGSVWDALADVHAETA